MILSHSKITDRKIPTVQFDSDLIMCYFTVI